MTVSVVLPCFNDAPHLKENVERVVQTLDLLNAPYEVILVNDGSPDNTGIVAEEVAEFLGSERIRVIHHAENRGRGAAFVSGAREAQGEIIGFLDVDLEVSSVYLVECVRMIMHDDADLVVGQRHYRLHFGLIYRHVLSRSYALLVSTVLRIPSSLDTESGYKFFKGSVLKTYLETFMHEGWFWDTEVVSRFYWDQRRIASVPCLFLRNADKTSTVRPIRDTMRYCRNLLAYWWASRGLRPTPEVCERRQEDLHQTAV